MWLARRQLVFSTNRALSILLGMDARMRGHKNHTDTRFESMIKQVMVEPNLDYKQPIFQFIDYMTTSIIVKCVN